MRDQGLLFAAGAAAQERGWHQPTVISDLDELTALTPSGSAVVVAVSAADLTSDAVQRLAAVHGAGRDVLIVTDTTPDEAIHAWLPSRCWHSLDVVEVNSSAQERLDTPGSATREVSVHPAPASLAEQAREQPMGGFADNNDPPLRASVAIADHPDERIRQEAAEDPATPPDDLAALAKDPVAKIQRLTAGNPSTPPTALAELAQNTSPRTRRAVASNPSTSPQVLASLVQDSEARVWKQAAANPHTAPAALATLTSNPDEAVRRLVAGNPGTPPELLAALSQDTDAETRRLAAQVLRASPEALAVLASDPDVAVRRLVAGNPGTPPGVLAVLAEDTEAEIRGLAAGQRATPAEALVRLAQDSEAHIRGKAAGNRSMPAAALTGLAKDPDEEVRLSVAGNRGTPPAALAALAQDSMTRVRAVAAGNEGTPLDALVPLVGDADTARVAAGRLTASPDTPADAFVAMAQSADEQVRTEAARHSATPAQRLAILAGDLNEDVREAVAANQNTRPPDLTKLANDQVGDVQTALLCNPNTPAEALRVISKTSDRPWKYYELALHPNAPTDVLRSLTGEPFSWIICKNPTAPLELRLWALEHGRFEEGSGPPDSWDWQIQGCEEWPEPLLKKFVDQEDWPPIHLWSCSHLSAGLIRHMAEKCLSQGSWADEYEGDCKRACLENPATPPDVIDRLAADPDPIVRLIVGSVMLRRPEFSDERAEALMRSCVHDAMTEEPEDDWDDSAKVVDDIVSDPGCPASVRAEIT